MKGMQQIFVERAPALETILIMDNGRCFAFIRLFCALLVLNIFAQGQKVFRTTDSPVYYLEWNEIVPPAKHSDAWKAIHALFHLSSASGSDFEGRNFKVKLEPTTTTPSKSNESTTPLILNNSFLVNGKPYLSFIWNSLFRDRYKP